MSRRCQYFTDIGLQCSNSSQVAPCPGNGTVPGACSEHHGQPWNFRIMDLPLELREMIIGYHFPERIGTRWPITKRDEDTGCGRIPDILLAAKQISNEARTVLYRRKLFFVIIDPVAMNIRFCNQSFKFATYGKMLNNKKHPQNAHFHTNFCAIAKNIRKFVVFIKLRFDCIEFRVYRPLLRNGIDLFLEMIARDPSNKNEEHRTLDVIFHPISCTWWGPQRHECSAVLETAREIVETFQSLEDVSINLSFESFATEAYGFEGGRWRVKHVPYSIRKELGRWVVDNRIEDAPFFDRSVRSTEKYSMV